jgi:hypothetical protein
MPFTESAFAIQSILAICIFGAVMIGLTRSLVKLKRQRDVAIQDLHTARESMLRGAPRIIFRNFHKVAIAGDQYLFTPGQMEDAKSRADKILRRSSV